MNHPVQGLYTPAPFTLWITPLRPLDGLEVRLLEKAFGIVENYGGLAAKLSQGNGVVKILKSELREHARSLPPPDKSLGILVEEKSSPFQNRGVNPSWPNLNDFFFGHYKMVFSQAMWDFVRQEAFFDEDHRCQRRGNEWEQIWQRFQFLPIASHIRYAIRGAIGNKARRHHLFGYVGRGEIYGSRVFVSHGYVDDGPETIRFRLYMYGATSPEIDAIGNALIQNLEACLFQDGRQQNRIQKLLLFNKPLIQNRQPMPNIRMSQLMKKGVGDGLDT